MALVLNVTDHWEDTKRIHIVGTLTASGNYPAGGDIAPFNDQRIKSSQPPMMIELAQYSASGDVTYTFVWVQGTTLANQKVKYITSATLAELAAGAYPGTALANPITFHAMFHKK